jgi:ribokinase
MAARLGAVVTMIARVGRDVFGQQMTANLKAEAIDTTHVVLDDKNASGTAAILVDDAAQNCIIVVPGANGTVSPADVREAANAIRQADAVVCQLEIPIEATLEAFGLARAAGVRTILNPAPARRLPAELLALTDLLVPNETELAFLTETTADQIRQLESAQVAARKIGVPRLIVTLGSEGAILVDANDAEHIPAPKVIAVDPTGAGDAFIGSLACCWAQGCSLREAARRASTLAAWSVTRSGAQASFPSRQEAEALWA